MSSQYFRFVAQGATHRRVPLLERLIARADGWVPVADWRADAFHVIAPQAACMPAVAVAALCADRGADLGADRVAARGADRAADSVADRGADGTAERGAVSAGWVCAATPVHYEAEMSSVRLPTDGILQLSAAEAETLVADFNRVWKGAGIRMSAARSAHLFCIFDRALDVVTHDPEHVLGQHIEEFLPTGADAAKLRQLISETEMWLFEHEANRARAKQNLPVINGVWFWGGGAPLVALPDIQGWAAGNDLFFNAFNLPWDEKLQNGVIAAGCVPGSDQWHAAESRWLRPAADKLRTRRIARLQISAADRCFTVTAGGVRRFWRSSKPWWESFE